MKAYDGTAFTKTVVLTGGTGYIGRSLSLALMKAGYRVRVLTRFPEKHAKASTLPIEYFFWNPEREIAPTEALEGVYGVIHLAGESVGQRWTAQKKKEMSASRVLGTRHLVEALARLSRPPEVLVGTSASGYYGDRGSEFLHEDSSPSHDFLAELCQSWEKETQLASALTRVAVIRVGVVLGRQSAALSQMLPVFRLGLGGPLGKGQQWMSWIHLKDLTKLYMFALENSSVSGILNGVAPEPVRNKEFTIALGKALGRPTIFPAPAFAIRALFGEMAAIILNSQRLVPERALEAGFHFDFPNIKTCLDDLLAPLGFRGAYTLEAQQWSSVERSKVFEFFSNAKNLEFITPPWLHFQIKSISDLSVKRGTLINYALRVRGIPIRWRTLIESWEPDLRFVDRMLKGPYKFWHHTHTFQAIEGGTLMTDQVLYRVPFGILGDLVAMLWVRFDVEKIFQFRQSVIKKKFPISKSELGYNNL